jgi:hypothetical protein
LAQISSVNDQLTKSSEKVVQKDGKWLQLKKQTLRRGTGGILWAQF